MPTNSKLGARLGFPLGSGGTGPGPTSATVLGITQCSGSVNATLSVTTTARGTWLLNLGNLPAFWWRRHQGPQPATRTRGIWLTNLGNMPIFWWRQVSGLANSGPVATLVGGLTRCSGSVSATITQNGGRGLTQCSGSIPAVNLSVPAQGTTQCSGSITAIIKAVATVVGVTQCSGSLRVVTQKATVRGMTQCSGFATIPIPASTLKCLQPPPNSTPTSAPPENAVY